MLSCHGICRRRFSAAFKATCLSFGQNFTADVIRPVLMASAAVPDQDTPDSKAEHLAKVSTHFCLWLQLDQFLQAIVSLI